jgi:hypothetical protein
MPSDDDLLREPVRRLVQPPERLQGGLDGVLYTLVDDSDQAHVRIWRAGSEEESEEIRRFEEAASRIDWSVPGIYEVRWEPVVRSNPRVASPQGPKGGGPEDEVYDTIDLVVRDDAVHLPTAEDLDAFEESQGFPLPASYRSFVLRFGIGEFGAKEIEIASPGYPKDLARYDLARMNRSRGMDHWSDDDLRSMFGPDTARARRLVLFAEDRDEGVYGWDTRDVTDPDRHEYGVYLLRESERMSRMAETFAEFVAGRCLTPGDRTYHTHRDHFMKQCDLAQAFLDETGWPLKPGQDVVDFAHGLHGEMHCTPKSKLSRKLMKWLKTRGIDRHSAF